MNEQRATQGLDHLQAAALEMIEAARAFLDVAEELVTDRDRVAEAVGVVSDLARAAARGASEGAAERTGPHEHDGGEPTESHVERITLSS